MRVGQLRHRVAVPRERVVPWVLALVAFPLLGAGLWTGLVWFGTGPFDSFYDEGVRFSPALALPSLVVAALLRARRIPIGTSVALVFGATVSTVMLAVVPVLCLLLSGVG